MNPLAGRYLTVVVGRQSLAIELSRVREIVGYLAMLPPGGLPSHVKGWIDYRGRSIRVIDMGARLGLEPNVQTEDTQIVICDAFDGCVGLLVDNVGGAVRVAESAESATPAFAAEYARGATAIGDGITTVLDLDRVITSNIAQPAHALAA